LKKGKSHTRPTIIGKRAIFKQNVHNAVIWYVGLDVHSSLGQGAFGSGQEAMAHR